MRFDYKSFVIACVFDGLALIATATGVESHTPASPIREATCNVLTQLNPPPSEAPVSHRDSKESRFAQTEVMLPPMVEDAFEDLVRGWTGHSPSYVDKTRFSRWFANGRIELRNELDLQCKKILDEVLGLEVAPRPRIPRREVVKFGTFILLSKSIGSSFPTVDTHRYGKPEDAIRRVGPLQGKTPIEIHEHLISQGWNLPVFEPYWRALYFWPSPTFESMAVIRIDSPRLEEMAHLHKEIVPSQVLLNRKALNSMSYDSSLAQRYDDNGTLSPEVIRIPINAKTKPDEFLPMALDPNVSAETLERLVQDAFLRDIRSLPDVAEYQKTRFLQSRSNEKKDSWQRRPRLRKSAPWFSVANTAEDAPSDSEPSSPLTLNRANILREVVSLLMELSKLEKQVGLFEQNNDKPNASSKFAIRSTLTPDGEPSPLFHALHRFPQVQRRWQAIEEIVGIRNSEAIPSETTLDSENRSSERRNTNNSSQKLKPVRRGKSNTQFKEEALERHLNFLIQMLTEVERYDDYVSRFTSDPTWDNVSLSIFTNPPPQLSTNEALIAENFVGHNAMQFFQSFLPELMEHRARLMALDSRLELYFRGLPVASAMRKHSETFRAFLESQIPPIIDVFAKVNPTEIRGQLPPVPDNASLGRSLGLGRQTVERARALKEFSEDESLWHALLIIRRDVWKSRRARLIAHVRSKVIPTLRSRREYSARAISDQVTNLSQQFELSLDDTEKVLRQSLTDDELRYFEGAFPKRAPSE